MKSRFKQLIFILGWILPLNLFADLPLYYWRPLSIQNFGDELSLEIIQRIVGAPVRPYPNVDGPKEQKLFALSSLLLRASTGDVIWGTGCDGKWLSKDDYNFSFLDVRAVRGPLTRKFLLKHFGIHCPDVYGDPALLLPYLFPEFKRSEFPKHEYIVISHYTESNELAHLDPEHHVSSTEPWQEVLEKILDSKFVISTSLHGIIVAEAYGIPARLLRITNNALLFKYMDYYAGTNRLTFQFATSIEEALKMGGEPPIQCDLQKLYNAFPFDFWPTAKKIPVLFISNDLQVFYES